MTPRRKEKQEQPWRFGTGERGCRVVAYERRGPGGPVYVQAWSERDRRYLKKSLRFRLRDNRGRLIPERVTKAEVHAMEQSAKLRQGAEALRQCSPSAE